MTNRQRRHDDSKQESNVQQITNKRSTLPKHGWPTYFKQRVSNSRSRHGIPLLLCLGLGMVAWSIFAWSPATSQTRHTDLVNVTIVATFLNKTRKPFLQGHEPQLSNTSFVDNSSRLVASARSLSGHFFVGIPSHLGNADQRTVARTSWMKHPLVQGGVFNVYFFVALDESSRYKMNIPATEAEAKEHSDLVAFKARKGVDGYTGLIWKTVRMLKYFVARAQQEGWMYFMKLDDSTYPRLGRLYTNLVMPFYSERRCEAGEIYAGYAIDDRPPRYMNGPGYVLSRKLAEAIVRPGMDLTAPSNASSLRRPSQCLDNEVAEDCWMGTWIANVSRTYKMRVTHVDLAGRGNYTPSQGCDTHLVFHWDASFHGMRCMWQEENRLLLRMDKAYADVGNICSKCYTISKVVLDSFGLKAFPEVGLVPRGLFFGCSKVGMGCISPLARPPGSASGACGHEYSYDASIGRYELSPTPTTAGWATMGRIGCATQEDSFAGIKLPNFKDCQDACSSISFCTSMEYDAYRGTCRLFAAEVCNPSRGRILQANETFWYLTSRSSVFTNPWKEVEMQSSFVSGSLVLNIGNGCLSSSEAVRELSGRHVLSLAMCKWLCIFTTKCAFMLWHPEDARNNNSLGKCHTIEENGCQVLREERLGGLVALQLLPLALAELRRLVGERWISAQLLQVSSGNANYFANLRDIEADIEQMVLPAPHWRDIARNHEIEDCILSGSVQDMTAYTRVGFDNFASFEASIFDCAKRCLAFANASSFLCVNFSYEHFRGTCRLHSPGAVPHFSAASTAGTPHLAPHDCKKASSGTDGESQRSPTRHRPPYEVQRGGEVLNSCVFKEVPPFLREPWRTPSQKSASQRVLDTLAAADPRHVLPVGSQARVFYWGCLKCRGGLDHQMWALHHLLAIATALHASLAVYGPQQMLTEAHSSSTAAASWWDSYFTTDPPIRRLEEVRCSTPTAYSFDNRDLDGFWRMLFGDDTAKLAQFVDPQAPICVSLNGGWYTLQSSLNNPIALSGTKFTRDLLRIGLNKVSFSPSGEVVELARQVLAKSTQLQQGYGMVHVRRGDKGAPACTSVQNVLDKMVRLASIVGDSFSSNPKNWVVMSNADKAWLKALQSLASAQNMTVITEHELPVVVDIKDNYLRYAVLQHLYGDASRVLYTYKPMRLRPNKADGVFLAMRLCGTIDEPAVPFANGGKTLKMNHSKC